MRIRMIALALPLVGLAACKTSSTQSAQEQGLSPVGRDAAAQNPPQKGERATAEIAGTIGEINGPMLTIWSDDGGARTLELVPLTSVRVNGEEARAADLQEGQSVRASFNTVGDRDIAVDVHAGIATGSDPAGATGSGTPGSGGTPEQTPGRSDSPAGEQPKPY